MIIIGIDYYPEFQQLASVDTSTGEFREARLQNPEQAEQFYRELAGRGAQVRIGMEASGHARWLERLLGELQFELWIGGWSWPVWITSEPWLISAFPSRAKWRSSLSAG